MVPLISAEMTAHGWMTTQEVTDILAIAEMTPGPFGLNCATFAGMNAAGIPGAIIANLGVLMPTLTVCILVGMAMERFQNSRPMKQMMVGIRPASLGMILGVLLSLSLENYMPALTVHWPSVVIGLLDAVLLLRCKLSIPVVIVLSSVLGVIFGWLSRML